ncbi:efflux RND transporter periplasmic adaptor subunit [Sandaracinus amylolyticus]|uniref:Macrolide-specific efflux protein MacA n=1 Tax=Sandaracinus amylolyticus TaxID=927083 RepID=A0A0F6W8X9_9BACT|nr:efflux RND transporter periplasmic adaptor subunit [Sandaracinus amylolyticus]AKF10456.1 Macrolide-specific efflux protein MacA [Sandaracinus amylolyticus]
MADAHALKRLGIPTRSRGRTVFVALAVVVAIAALSLAVMAWRRRTPPPSPYESARVERGDLTATVTATGTLAATNTVTIGAEVSGRVARVLVEPNDRVNVGDVLVELDPIQLQAQVREARANVSAVQASLRVARATAEEAARTATRAAAMHGRGLVPDSELEQANAARERAEAQLASANAQLEVARATLARQDANLERAVIRSPISGVVLTRTVEPGQAIAAQFQTPELFEVAEDLARMRLTVDIDEADVGRVQEGQRATFTVDAYPDRTFDATIHRVDLAPTTEGGVVAYRAMLDVDNAEALLRPGMTATATIVTQRFDGVLLVPDPALRFAPPAPRSGPDPTASLPEGARIWTLENGSPRPHVVRVVASNGVRTVIEGEGISEGTEVLTGVVEP